MRTGAQLPAVAETVVEPGMHLGPPAPQCSHFSCKMSNYLIGAPIVQRADGDTKDDSRPREISSDGISEDMERIQAREVAFWFGSPVSFTDYAWLSV